MPAIQAARRFACAGLCGALQDIGMPSYCEAYSPIHQRITFDLHSSVSLKVSNEVDVKDRWC